MLVKPLELLALIINLLVDVLCHIINVKHDVLNLIYLFLSLSHYLIQVVCFVDQLIAEEKIIIFTSMDLTSFDIASIAA